MYIFFGQGLVFSKTICLAKLFSGQFGALQIAMDRCLCIDRQSTDLMIDLIALFVHGLDKTSHLVDPLCDEQN